MKFKVKILLLLLFVVSGNIYAQLTVKFMSYNLLNYPGSDTATRNPYFRTVISAAKPDILVVQELNDTTGYNRFYRSVMRVVDTNYTTGIFINGPDSDNGIYFNKNLFTFVSNTPIQTALRDITEFIITDKLYNNSLRIYSVHLKASTEVANQMQRAAEVDSLRKVTNSLPAGTNYIVCGDFNIYRGSELAYKKLILDSTNYRGYFIDPINAPTGSWQDNSSIAIYHTQSTRTRSFGGGATGGLDDRFDFILYSPALSQPGGIDIDSTSYAVFGNDGNHLNDSINKQPNTAVPVNVADALHYTSDHLPVIANFIFYPSIINIKVTTEGLYDSINNRNKIRDTVTAYLRNISPPYSIIDSSSALIDSISLTGKFYFKNAPTGTYYIHLKHRNSLEIWSKSDGISFLKNGFMSYDFTSSQDQTYGNNSKLKGSLWCMYSGDINQDGYILTDDYDIWFNDFSNGVSGFYNRSDLNFDGQILTNDFDVWYNNFINGIVKISPP